MNFLLSCSRRPTRQIGPIKNDLLEVRNQFSIYTFLFCSSDMDFCAAGHRCHANAECLNLATRYACRCRSGFVGNGYHCEDIDECSREPEEVIKLCGYNSHCINTPGGYRCECSKGFETGPYNLCRGLKFSFALLFTFVRCSLLLLCIKGSIK